MVKHTENQDAYKILFKSIFNSVILGELTILKHFAKKEGKENANWILSIPFHFLPLFKYFQLEIVRVVINFLLLLFY